MNEQEATKRVTDFCAVWGTRDLGAIMAYFADDAVYHNMPMEALHGKPAIEQTIAGFVGMSKAIEFKVLATAANGHTVMTERVDSFDTGDRKIALPVMGVFELRDNGLIGAWRDYFDMAAFTGA